MQQQPHQLNTTGIPFFCQPVYTDGNPAQWIAAETAKSNQYQTQWEANGGNNYVTGTNYGPGQVPGGGGQPRVGVGPQQHSQPSQPTPTSTPPGIHDMSKQPLQPNPGPMSFQRTINPMYPPRNSLPQQPQPLRASIQHTQRMPYSMSIVTNQVMAQPSPVPHPQFVLYQQSRQAQAYPNQAQMYNPQQLYFASNPNPGYFSSIPGYPTGLPSSGPSPQATTAQPAITLMRPPLMPNQPPTTTKQDKRQRNPLKIINPETQEEVQITEDIGTNNNNVTPNHSNDSSARETPQPGAGTSVPSVDNTVAAEFAAKVAACAMDEHTPAQSPTPDSVPSDSVSDSDSLHKQHSVVPINSETVTSTSTLSTASEEFVPRFMTQVQRPSELPVEQQLLPTLVPTVSAETDSPPVEIQRVPSMAKNPCSPSVLAQSPLKTTKKQKSSENERQQTAALPPPLPPQADNKKGPKSVQWEDPLSKDGRDKLRPAVVEQQPVPENIMPTLEEVPNSPVTPSVVTILPSAGKEVKTQVIENSSDTQPQHQNGETVQHEPPPVVISANIPSPVDSNKTSKSKSGKKSGNKMRDLNRRGTEKEGSEMDAFTTTEPTIMNEEKEIPSTSPPPTPPPVVPEPVDKIQEDLEEKEDKLVAAKNEENAKVSALNRPEPEPSPVVEEKQPPQLTLKHSYSKDQWSPLNPEGKKKYGREFLINLRGDPLCVKKPENLPDVVAGMFKDTSAFKNLNYMNRPDAGGFQMMPTFLRAQTQRGQMAPKRNSQQGNKKGGSRVIQMSLSLNEDVKLKTTENAWKPNRLDANAGKTEEEKDTEELLKNVRGILNKLTPQKFDKLMEKFRVLPINSEMRLTEVINLIFDKAVDEPSFSKSYAQMCKLCSKLEVIKIENNVQEKVNFRKLLITRCQTEFEKNKAAELDAEKWQKEIDACDDPEKRKETQLAYDEKERQIRMKSVGNIRFIGELFKLGMLTPAIMYRCIENLLSNPAEESLECLCKLLTTIGKDLEFGTPGNKPQPGPPPTQLLNPFFQKMAELSQKKGNSKVSSRVRFMLQDVIDLRENKWVPRREDNNPKTIEQINKDAERESMEKSLALSQPPPRMNRQNDRPDNRKRGNQNDSDGWNTVTSNSRFHNQKYTATAFDSSKLRMSTKDDNLNNIQLGGSLAYRFPSGAKNADKPNPTFTSSNAFSALSKGEDRKPPSNLNNRRMTQTPSIEREKERQRMLIVTSKEYDGRSSRENSVHREKESSTSQQVSVEIPTHTRRDEDGDSRLSEEDLYKAKEKLERQSQTLIEEYLNGLSAIEDIRSEVEQLCNKDNCGDFVIKALEMGLEKKAPAQKNVGLLISALLDCIIFSTQVVTQQFASIYEMADDFAIDIPKFWELQAQIIVPILAAQKLNFSHFKDACSSVLKSTTAPKLLHPILSLLASEKGEGFVRSLWDSSNVSLEEFLPDDVNVNAFVEEKSLKYLTGEYEVRLPMDQVQEGILRLIQNKQPFEKILEFIKANVGDKEDDVSFIRALVTAFCEACITGPQKSEFNLDLFEKYKKIVTRFVDGEENKELACLSSIHILCSRLQHPQGLILNIFKEFSENKLISNEAFRKWKDDKHETLEHKGVSLLSLTSFFTNLEEFETDDENS